MNWYKKAQSKYQTKDGRLITFQIEPLFESSDRRGWVVHKITAIVDNKEAGYIKLSYIPREKWDQTYQGNVWKFRRLALGHCDVSDELAERNNDEEIRKYFEENYNWRNSEYYTQREKEKAQKEADKTKNEKIGQESKISP